MLIFRFGGFMCILLAGWSPVRAADAGIEAPSVQADQAAPRDDGAPVYLTAPALFELADEKARAGEVSNAITIYRALERDRDVTIRSEARFRHGQLLARQNKFAEAAVLYRAILDEQPQAQRIRLELAAVLARIGDVSAARKMLREAQAGGLPPDLARAVNQYAAALRSRKPLSASMEISLAPSTNINRSTSERTLDTILAPFQLSDDARAKSGVGIKIGGQSTARSPISSQIALLTRVSGQANFYRDGSFNDVTGSLQVGAEDQLGKLRIQPLAGRSWRWYGGKPYATTNAASINLLKPLGAVAQIQVDLGFGYADYNANDFQDGPLYNANVTYERSFSPRFGGSIAFGFDRQKSHDPGYATMAYSSQILTWRDAGKTSFYLSAGISRLMSDKNIFLFKDKRREWQFRSSAGAVLRALTVSHFSPVIRLTYERNRSTVGLYDYRRFGAELGISRAF